MFWLIETEEQINYLINKQYKEAFIEIIPYHNHIHPALNDISLVYFKPSNDIYVSVGTIGNGGSTSSNLSAATNANTNLVLGNGTLIYTGAGETSDRAFTISAGTTATIDNSATLTLAGATGTTTGALTKTNSGTLNEVITKHPIPVNSLYFFRIL